MDNKEDLPPKTVKAQLVRLDDNLKQIERKQFAGIQRAPGSLPVLEAFQIFLENERKVAQRRLRLVTGFAIGAILAVMLFAGLFIHYALRNVDARTDLLAYTTAGMEQSLGTLTERQQRTDDRLLQAARHLAAQRKSIEEQTNRIASQQQSVAAEREEREAELATLRAHMTELIATQETIQRMLAANTPPRRRAAEPAETRPNTVGPFRRREERNAPSPDAITYEIVTLAPEGRAGVRWMLPVANAQE